MDKKIILFILGLFLITSSGYTQNRGRSNRRNQQKRQLWRQRTLTEIDSIVWDMEGYLNQKKQEDRLKELQEKAGKFGTKEKVEALDLNKRFHSGTRRQQGLNQHHIHPLPL